MRKNLTRVIVVFIVCVCSVKARTQSFTATYPFTSVTTASGTTDPTPVPTATGTTFGSFLAVGTPANPNAGGRFSFTDWAIGATNGSDVFTGSVNTAEYYEVTITPQAGFTLDLNTISFTLQRSGTGIRQYAVRSSIDGYANNLPASINPLNSNLQVVGSNIFQVSDATTSAENGSKITLSGFTGLSGAVSFRFYGWNAEASGGTFSIDNVVFSGSTTTAVDPNAPVLTVSPSSLSFPATGTGTTSASLTYALTGANLTNDVTVSTAAPYSVSDNNTDFSTSINILKTDAALQTGKTIYVRFSPAGAGTQNGSVTNASAGAITKTVTLNGTGIGLINLTTPPYLQNFDGIGTGLSVGISVKTGATASALGTDAVFSPTPALWNNTSGGFKNFASGNNDQGVAQNTATDRAIGVRQVSATDPGPAFVFQVANTTGKINFILDFNLQSLDATSPRITTWRVDYGFGANPSAFIVPATTGILTTGGNRFSNNPVHVDFGNALDNQSGIITIRIVALTASSGSGNRASTGIDDFTLSWEDPTAKTISLSTASINFPTTNIGNSSTLSYKIVSQTNLDQPITITATSPYTISADNINFSADLSVAPADAFNKTIYVKFSPDAVGVFPGSITHSSEGVVSKMINVSAEAIDPAALSFNFNTCSVSSIPGSGFLSINVTGSQKWGCSQYGRNSTNGVDVNGFSSGAAQTNDAWLISPALNLNGIVNIPVLSFYSRGEFSGPKLQLFVSTTYSGSGIPNIADWTELNGNFPTPPGSATTTWTFSDNIDLSAYKSAPVVYIAFRYTSSPALNAARWSVDDIAVTDQSTLLTVNPVQLNFGEVSVGTNSTSQSVSFQAMGSNDLTLTPPSGYQISTDNNTFSTGAIVIDQATAAAGTTLYVRFSPTVKALKVEGNINATATGLNKDIVALTGSSYPKSETFDVGCYNISFFGANSTNTATPTEIATQVANISTVMQHLNMDVIGIEEMSNDDALVQLTANLPGYASVMSNRWSYSFEPPDPNFPPQKTGFIYNTATMTLSTTEPPRVMFESMYDSARLDLPGHRLADYPTGTPSSFWASGRLPFMATFNAVVDGVTQKIRVVVIHAKSGGDAVAYARRQYDVQVLKDSLDAFYANDKVLIVGDYNDRVVTSIYVGHSSSYLSFVNDSINYNIVTLPLDQAGRASFPGDAGMIDHITISNDMAGTYIPNSTDIEDPRLYIANYNATTASDHLPVFSRYLFCKLTCPADVTISNTPGQCGASVNFDISSTMTCGTVTAVPASGSFFPVGTTTVHVTASTGETCSFTVMVNDNENPTITAPTAVNANNDPGKCYATIANIGIPQTNDNCGVQSVTNNAPENGQFPIGETTVTWTITDVHGNTATATQTVTVVDNENPVISCAGNQTRNTNANLCSYAVAGTEFDPLAGDNCTGTTIANDYNNSNTLAGELFNKGQTTVTWTITDASGNTATCSFVVTVEDHQAPVISAPAGVTVTPNNSSCTAKNVALGSPVTSDNCTGLTVSNNAPLIFPLGTTTVTWKVTDASGNSATANQNVTVAVNPPITVSIPDVFAVNPGGEANTIYVGYGPTSLTLNAIVSGGAGSYSYKWTTGSSAGPALNNTSSYTVNPTSTTTYYFNVKDLYGCNATVVTKTVYVTDVRCGAKKDKVTVCQLVKGKYSTSCLATKDVSSALANGGYLGDCSNAAIVTTAAKKSMPEMNELVVSALPNPSANYFTIVIKGGNASEKLSVRVIDILGRRIERKDNLQTNSTLRIGNNYYPGVYIVEVIQGTNHKQIKLIKAGN
jgi:hypothetical protein